MSTLCGRVVHAHLTAINVRTVEVGHCISRILLRFKVNKRKSARLLSLQGCTEIAGNIRKATYLTIVDDLHFVNVPKLAKSVAKSLFICLLGEAEDTQNTSRLWRFLINVSGHRLQSVAHTRSRAGGRLIAPLANLRATSSPRTCAQTGLHVLCLHRCFVIHSHGRCGRVVSASVNALAPHHRADCEGV